MQVVEGADCETDIGTIPELEIEQPTPKLLLFDNIKGYPRGFRVASTVFSPQRRTALPLGLPEDAGRTPAESGNLMEQTGRPDTRCQERSHGRECPFRGQVSTFDI